LPENALIGDASASKQYDELAKGELVQALISSIALVGVRAESFASHLCQPGAAAGSGK
jgi:hypothetical protein